MLQTAVIAQRVDQGEPETKEIRELTEAAGARVVGTVTQTRPEDPGTEFGAGKLAELHRTVEETGADTVVVDTELTPQQTVNIEEAVGATVLDRHRVVLEIFASQANDRRSKHQVELARLRYRLPRVRERADEGLLNRTAEKGTRYYDIEDRIDELQRKLAELPPPDQQLQERRQQEGFDLIALAGYTNAGKSTLLRRLADEMSLETETHDDLSTTATTADQLFETLETTRRRATINGRKTLVTDTVGFLSDLPHWLVESFRGTLAAVEAADAVVVVLDGAQDTDRLREKLDTVSGTIGPDHPPVVPALNKADLLDTEAREQRAQVVREQIESVPGGSESWERPVLLSALEGSGIPRLCERIERALPGLVSAELSVPLTDEGMSVLSWLYDNAASVTVSYGTEVASVSVEAKPRILEQAQAKESQLHHQSPRG